MLRKSKNVLIGCIVCIMTIFSPLNYFNIEANAYLTNGYVMSNPSNVKYKMSSYVGPYSSETVTYATKWASYCNEIGMSAVTSGENIYFYGDFSVDNGTYATTYSHSDNYHTITYYKAFTQAASYERYETIVHEVGHALGLAHCQFEKESISVMRITGFNNKAYPLSDDKAGISSIY